MKRTSTRVLYDRAVRWIAENDDPNLTVQPNEPVSAVRSKVQGMVSEQLTTVLVADIFDVDPMAVAKHVLRVRNGTAPALLFMPTSQSARRERVGRQRAEFVAMRRLREAGVAVGTRWWSEAHGPVQVVAVQGGGGDANVTVHSPDHKWTVEYRSAYFLRAYTRVLPVTTEEVTP